jgi:phytanoyl-CoA hydroxylase
MHPDPAEAPEAYPALTAPPAFREFFQREGYIVIRNALPNAVCAEAVDGFLKEVHLDTRALFQRHAGAAYAAHVYTSAGHMRHPIANLPDISGRRYPQFKSAGLALLTDPLLRRAIETLLGEPVRLVRSMYFDGHQASSAHRDGDDAADGAPTIGAWIAAEDIDPGAGRFFVLPQSHFQEAHGPLVAPAMRQGDLLLWNARMIHGSLPATAHDGPRRAFTGYYTGRSQRIGRGAGVMLGGMEVLHYSDHRSLAGRAAILLRAEYPAAYTALRRLRQWPWGSNTRV